MFYYRKTHFTLCLKFQSILELTIIFSNARHVLLPFTISKFIQISENLVCNYITTVQWVFVCLFFYEFVIIVSMSVFFYFPYRFCDINFQLFLCFYVMSIYSCTINYSIYYNRWKYLYIYYISHKPENAVQLTYYHVLSTVPIIYKNTSLELNVYTIQEAFKHKIIALV